MENLMEKTETSSSTYTFPRTHRTTVHQASRKPIQEHGEPNLLTPLQGLIEHHPEFVEPLQ